MKILHALFSFNIGGTETMLIDIINEQVKSHEIIFVIVNKSYRRDLLNKIDKKVKVYLINRPEGSKNPWYILKTNIILWQQNPDIIHTHDNRMCSFLRLRHGAPLVFTKHNVISDKCNWNLIDFTFGISKAAVNVANIMGAKKCSLVYNGIHVGLIKNRIRTRELWDAIHFVVVGRIEDEKGQKIVVESIKKLKDRNIRDIYVDFIGDGNTLNDLRKMINSYGLRDQIRLLGFRDRSFIYSHLCNYDAFIQPSLSEGFGLTIAEAIAARIPVIASDQDGSMEVLDGGRLGILFHTGDIDDLTDKIYKLKNGGLSVDTDKAFQFVKENFDIKMTARNYIEKYKFVIHNNE